MKDLVDKTFLDQHRTNRPLVKKFKPALLLCLVPIGFILTTYIPATGLFSISKSLDNVHALLLKDQCRQVEPLFPGKTTSALDDILSTISTPSYKEQSINYLSNAVRIPTISYDGMKPPGQDKRWEIFYDFAGYLNKTFPRVHNVLTVEKVNTHGLLYTWKGGNQKLKPTLLMAHQDVVPVPESTIPTW